MSRWRDLPSKSNIAQRKWPLATSLFSVGSIIFFPSSSLPRVHINSNVRVLFINELAILTRLSLLPSMSCFSFMKIWKNKRQTSSNLLYIVFSCFFSFHRCLFLFFSCFFCVVKTPRSESKLTRESKGMSIMISPSRCYPCTLFPSYSLYPSLTCSSLSFSLLCKLVFRVRWIVGDMK
jgi:hypothetical protein